MMCKNTENVSLSSQVSQAGKQTRDRRSTERAKVMRAEGDAGGEVGREGGTAFSSVTDAFR